MLTASIDRGRATTMTDRDRASEEVLRAQIQPAVSPLLVG